MLVLQKEFNWFLWRFFQNHIGISDTQLATLLEQQAKWTLPAKTTAKQGAKSNAVMCDIKDSRRLQRRGQRATGSTETCERSLKLA